MNYKLFISSVIIGLSVAGAVFIVQSNNLNNISNLQVNDNDGNNIDLTKSLTIPTTEKSNSNTSNYKASLDAILNEKSNIQTTKEENLTELLAKEIEKGFFDKNPAGAEIIEGNPYLTVPDTDKLMIDFLVDAQNDFNLQDYIPEITDEDIKITNENTEKNISSYSRKFDEIVSNAKLVISENSFNELDLENLGKVINVYKKSILDFYKLIVPDEYKELHKTEIKYLTAELNLLEIIKNYKEDPIMSMLASENFSILEEKFMDDINIELQKLISS